MRRTYKTKFIGRRISTLISGGWGRHGPYVYGGIKTKKGKSIGGSIGTQGRQLYGSHNTKSGQVRVKYNIDTQKVSPRVKLYKKSRINYIINSISDLINRRL